MPRVVCTLRNASHVINGWRFAELPDGGMLSEDLPDEVAAEFLAIRGYAPFTMPRVTPLHHEVSTERPRRSASQKESA
jgi:hypothetical protein